MFLASLNPAWPTNFGDFETVLGWNTIYPMECVKILDKFGRLGVYLMKDNLVAACSTLTRDNSRVSQEILPDPEPSQCQQD